MYKWTNTNFIIPAQKLEEFLWDMHEGNFDFDDTERICAKKIC